ncbi:MAG: alpha-mannosidase [Clostridia bacterium]|nr:alpha-mannosidase [Clostridia bacterium]
MNNKAYIDRTYKKFDSVMNIYARYLFKSVAKTDAVLALETADHLRLPPDDSAMTEIAPGYIWGGEYSNIWLKTSITVPAEADGEILCAIPDVNAVEILCFKNGKPAGIINSKNRFLGGDHSFMFVDAEAKAGETIDLAFECYAGHFCAGTQPYDNYGRDEDTADYKRAYNGIRFCTLDKVVRDCLFDLATVLQMARLPGENFLAMKAHECLIAAFPYLIQDPQQVSADEIRESCAIMSEKLAPALEKSHGDASRGKIGVMGHSHMDTAWLWPVSETVRKCARTYSQALTLMDMYPEYTFIQSSALHLDWMREYYPDIFEGIRQRVAEGRYEPNGGVWVECDCNITGGESMVRQFLYGQRFTQQHLGYRSDAFWLPDTFGYNAAIPQIMQESGVKYFYTTKMSWNDLNQFPADTFRWRGMDGTEVITHLNRMHLMPDVSTLTGAVGEIRDKKSNNQRLAAYGFGDGGGGPTYGMLEFLKRVTDVEGMPEIKPTTASEYMHTLEDRKDKLPVYDGELYLEFHRGTLTQMHDIKKNNRVAETALKTMELMNVLSNEEVNARRDDLYKVLLKNQFHDILPGTSIPKVNETARAEMTALIEETKAITDAYAAKLTETADGKVSVYNPLSFDRSGVIDFDGAIGIAGKPAQVYTDVDGKEKTAVQAIVPAMSALTFDVTEPAPAERVFKTFEVEDGVLTTPYYKVKFDENGYISSLYDIRVNREVKRAGGASLGTLWLAEDMPTAYDNWEIEDDIFLKMQPVTALVSSEVVSDGAVEYRIRNTYKIGRATTAVVDTVFYAGDPRIDYQMKIDWNERRHLLKAGFDVDIRAMTVKNEIQFGHVERPTTRNTSLESAKFEVCNHKWSDISESRYGVAVLNDCKYGISVEGSDMRLTLHKGGCRPDTTGDKGVHYMTYSLLPHVGAFSAETVVQPAYILNTPVVKADGAMNVPQLCKISAPNVICEAVKNAEDVPGAYVLRLYECERNLTNCKVALHGAKRVYRTNMLEEVKEELALDNGTVSLTVKPFEIVTLLVER